MGHSPKFGSEPNQLSVTRPSRTQFVLNSKNKASLGSRLNPVNMSVSWRVETSEEEEEEEEEEERECTTPLLTHLVVVE
jgi:hypothetical protein